MSGPRSGDRSSPIDGFGFEDGEESWLARLRSASEAVALGSLGQYELLEEVGRGAQGVVYRARAHGSEDIVALKRLIGGSVATASGRSRFVREAVVEASMNHPHIVGCRNIHIVGGLPVIVMDWVDGEPVDRWCHPQRSLAEILALFLKVCDAVWYAHQRGVIHRDLKPTNILVDRDGEPRVLDFGLARCVDDDGSRLTRSDGFVGTLAYAAPERLSGRQDRIDVRTDVYSLGVVLYEMLTGARPFAESELASLVEAIQATEPSPPSNVNRRPDREVDAIVLKALCKDPDGRYESAAALAADIRRYLRDEPVLARPPRAAYRLRKFARRHRAAVTAGFAAAVVLVAGIGTAIYAREAAERGYRRAEATSGFLKQILTLANPALSQGQPVTVRGMLDEAARKLDGGALRGQPLVEADVRQTVGTTYIALAVHEAAVAQLGAAVTLLSSELGPEDPATLGAMTRLGEAYCGAGEVASAEALTRRVLPVQRRVLGSHHPDTHLMLRWRSWALVRLARYDEGESLAREAFEGTRRTMGPDHVDTAGAMVTLAYALILLGRASEAETLCRRAVDIDTIRLGPAHPTTLLAMHTLGLSLSKGDRLDEAVVWERRTLDLRRQVLGDDHTQTLGTMANLGDTLQRAGQFAEAAAVERAAFTGFRNRHGPANPFTIRAQRTLANILSYQGQDEEALTLALDALANVEPVLGSDHFETLATIGVAGRILFNLGRLDESEGHLRRSVEIARRAFGPTHSVTEPAVQWLADLWVARGRLDEACFLLRELLESYEAEFGPDDPRTAARLDALAWCLLLSGRPGEAEELARAALRIQRPARRTSVYEHVQSPLATLALAAHRRGASAEALGMFELLARHCAATPPRAYVSAPEIWIGYAQCLDALGRAQEIDGTLTAIAEAAGTTPTPRRRAAIEAKIRVTRPDGSWR